MNRFMLTVTVATAAILGTYNATAQTVLYTAPGKTVTETQAVPLGQFIAGRVTDKDAGEFKNWLASSTINGTIDPKEGYTAFVVIDSDFDASKPEHPIEHYIVSGRAPVATMHGNADEVTALNGDSLTLARTGDSYYVEGMRVNNVIKNPEGTIYVIGGPVSAFDIF